MTMSARRIRVRWMVRVISKMVRPQEELGFVAAACDPRSDPGEFDVLCLAPGQEAEHPASVGGPGVRVAELGADR